MQKIFHIDLNFMMLRKELFRPLLKRVAELGYNTVLWEVEDKIQWETCPECVRPDAFTKAEFAELLAYSRSLGLEPIPLVQTLGHAEYVLNHEEYAPMREGGYHDTYCISRVSVLNLLQNWIREYIELFGDIHDFHLGGDEAWSFGKCPECAEKIRNYGKLGFAMTHYAALADRLIRAGIRPNMWADLMLQHQDEVKKHLPLLKHFRIWDWQYASNWDSTFETTEVLSSFGLNVVLCSSIRSWGDKIWIPGTFHLDNAASTAEQAVKRGLSAYCVTTWTVRLIPYELQSHLMAVAPLSENVFSEAERLAVYRKATGFENEADADDFLRAAALAAADFPYSMAHTFGISWNGRKDHELPPHGWLEAAVKKNYENGIPVGECDAAETKLNEAETVFTHLAEKNPDRIAPWLDALSLEKAHLQLIRYVAVRDPAGKAFVRELKGRARAYFRKSYTDQSAEEAVLSLYSAASEFFINL